MSGLESKLATSQTDLTGGTSSSPSDHENEFRDTQLPHLRFWLLSLGLCLGLFMSMLDASIVATSLFTIGADFGSLQQVNWVALAYTLSYLSCAVFFARVADVIGRRNAFLASFFIFFSFSLGCGFSQNLTQLIACRALQGLGGSGLYSITMIIFQEVAPNDLKKVIAGLVGMVIAISGVLGPLLGGVLTRYASWRWVFWINGPIGFCSMVIFYLTWPKDEYLPSVERRSWKDLDFVGSFLLIAAAVLTVFAFQDSETGSDDWGQAIFLAPLIVGIFCWVALFAWEVAIERWGNGRLAPAFPLELLKNRVYITSVLHTMFLGFPYLMIIYAFPLRLQVVNGKSALDAGLMLLPMLGATAVASFVGSSLSQKKNRISETLGVGAALIVLGCALLTTVSPSLQLEAKALGFLVFIGFGFGMTASSSTMLAFVESPIRESAPGQGIMAQSRILGGSIGIAASSAILGVQTRSQLAGVVPPSALSSLQSSASTLTPAQLGAVRHAYADAFTEDMKLCAAVAGAAVLLALGTYRRSRIPIYDQRALNIEKETKRRRAAAVAEAEAEAGASE